MSTKQNRFAGVPRGKTLRNAEAVAVHVWRDKRKRRSAYRLPRDEFGLSVLAGKLTGYEGWVDFALATRAQEESEAV
jgi:hypothetical protein